MITITDEPFAAAALFGVVGTSAITAEAERLCRLADPCHDAAVAELAGVIVGVASFQRTSIADRRAEFAMFVDDDHHGRGIGTLVLEHLAAPARIRGIEVLIGGVPPGNGRMRRVAHNLTAVSWSRFDDGIVDVGLPTTNDDAAQGLADDRERHAERGCLRPLLAPTSVAVFGAGRQPGGIGHETLRPSARTASPAACTPSIRTAELWRASRHSRRLSGARGGARWKTPAGESSGAR